MRVLMAFDATPQCMDIARHAACRPWPPASRFLLLHILDPYPFSKMPISLGRAKDAALKQLEAVSEPLAKAGWKVETKVLLGRARQDVSKCAVAWKADLVFVGSNEAGALMRALLGSTAQSVLRQAPCSVEVVRLPEQGAEDQECLKILLATDNSKFSAEAVRSVANRPWPAGTKVKVLAIPEPFMPLGEFPYFESKEIESLNTRALKSAKLCATSAADKLAQAGLETSVETPFPTSSTAREIVKEAKRWGARMVVLGSHGRSGFERWTIGSVSEHVALHAHCSVEVIRRPRLSRKAPGKNSKKGAIQ
jgi:nucleotide-binding universal stress UspA family protein